MGKKPRTLHAPGRNSTPPGRHCGAQSAGPAIRRAKRLWTDARERDYYGRRSAARLDLPGHPHPQTPPQMQAKRKRGRVVEGSGLENQRAGNRTVGSNPTASANHLISFDKFGSQRMFPSGNACAFPAVARPAGGCCGHCCLALQKTCLAAVIRMKGFACGRYALTQGKECFIIVLLVLLSVTSSHQGRGGPE